MMVKDTVIVKSAIWEVLIESALNGSDDPPEPFSNWLAEYDEIQQRSVEAIENVEAATQSLLDMTVAAETLEPGTDATVQKDRDKTGAVHLLFGIPEGKRGNSVDDVDYDSEAGNLVFTMEDGNTHDVSMDDVKAHIDESIQESNAYVEQRLEEVQPDWQKVVDAAEAAEASKTAAAASAEAADKSATSANGFRTMAARHASDANNSAVEAEQYRDSANTYSEQASTSA